MIYYRVSRNKYIPGDSIWEAEIGPNNRANLILYRDMFTQNNELLLLKTILSAPDTATTAKEGALEAIRLKGYPELPSRFEHMMVFKALDEARAFVKKYRPEGMVYEIEYPDEALFFCGDMIVLDDIGGIADLYNNLIKMANTYWSGGMTEKPLVEVILAENDKATVVRLV